jgi:16S rRNA (guanine527-N7)-methyltransferase
MTLDADRQDKLSWFKNHILEVNRRINLVSRRDSSEVVEDLIADSLAIMPLIDYPENTLLLDVGSGAGFPWIVHKIARPDLQIVSVDSNQRRIEFQRDVARQLGFARCVFHADRVENLSDINADYCIAKAFGTVALICGLAGRHLRTSGKLVLPRSADEPRPSAEIAALGFAVEHDFDYSYADRKARLLILRKS